ncbi:MAG: hypothetical protein AB7H96_18230 [Vicinamibacterales bacterium]
MQDNRCPNCENDITTTVNTAVAAMVQAGDTQPRAVECPHCSEPLVLSARVTTTLQREVVVA